MTTSSRSLAAAALVALTALTGCLIQKPATEVPAPPAITSFSASASQVAKGGKVTLTWSTANATSIELREASAGALDVAPTTLAGTYQATVDAPSLFVLVARGPGGADARAVSVSLEDPGVTDVTFQALPPDIIGGGSSTLAWSALGARTVTLTAGGQAIELGGQRSSGAVVVAPSFDTTYTLTADAVTKTATVKVSPTLIDASLSKRGANVGETVTVRWSAAGADKLTLTGVGRGTLFETTTAAEIVSGSFADTVPQVPDNGVVLYELAIERGTTRITRELTLRVGTGLAITRFTAPPVAAAGLPYQVRWETINADAVELKVDGATVYTSPTEAVALSGSYAFQAPTADFAVELIARNSAGSVGRQLYQVDAVGVPTAVTLTASPATVAVGAPVTLTWASTDARRVRIVSAEGETVHTVLGQPAEGGSVMVYPAASTTFTVSADNQLGANPVVVTATAAVTVTGTPPAVDQFPPTAIAGQAVQLTAPMGSLLYGFPHTQVLRSTQADFIDISGTGLMVIEPGGTIATVDLPFQPLFWGRRMTGSLSVSRNGWLAWGTGLAELATNSTAWPSTTGPGGMIAPFWDALSLASTSGVYVQLVGTAPEQELVVQWDKMLLGTDTTTQLTFQARVHQRGMVSFQYKTMQLSATYAASNYLVGLQDHLRASGRTLAGLPASNSALYFFSPVAPPIELRATFGAEYSGYLKSGNIFIPVLGKANTVRIPADLTISEIMHRPDPSVPAGQYIELYNPSQKALDLNGWQLGAAGVSTFAISSSFVLPPGGTTVIGASTDPAQNDDAGVALAWGSFALSRDAGSFTVGTADASVVVSYVGPSDGGVGASINLDSRSFVGTTGSPGPISCRSTTPFSALQLGSPGAQAYCEAAFPYIVQPITANFRDLTDAGTPVFLGAPLLPNSDQDTLTVPLTIATSPTDPAPVMFGARVPVVSVSSDGFMVPYSTVDETYGNDPNPSTSFLPGKLAIFWEDLTSVAARSPPGNIYWRRFNAGEDPNTPAAHWVFQWARFSYWLNGTDDMNFEIKLFEDGTIEYHYATMLSGSSSNYANGNSASVWLERPDGSLALVLSINTPSVVPNTAFRFVPR